MDVFCHQSKFWFQTILTIVFTSVLCNLTSPIQARELTFQTKKFVYKAENKPLPDLLRDFAASQSTPIIVAEGVTGVVNANFDLTPQTFLKTMSLAFGIIWYFDGVTLYIYPSQMMQTQFFKIKGYSPGTVLSTLRSFGLGDKQYPLKFQSGENLLMAYGPPRHIELVEAVIATLNDNEGERSKAAIQIFTLRHASAVDRRVGGNTLPGVASTLRAIFAPSGASAGASGSLNDSTDATIGIMNRLSGTPEQRLGFEKAAKDATSLKVATAKTPKQPMMRTQELSSERKERGEASLSFTADEGTNSVIARLPPELIKSVSDLIAKLDAPSEMIEISAVIIDISSDELDALGFDWRYQTGSVQVSASTGAAAPVDIVSAASGAAFNVTTLISSAGRELLSRIRALESKGSAQIIAQPKVLGAANRTATLTDKRTASVRVAGNLDAQLFSVEAGTTLQVVPRLIADLKQPKIGLDLFIEDGGFSAQTVDQIPVVQRTTVRTDAVLNEGQSLLVGGITVESRRSNSSGVRGLGRIPFFGALFRNDENTSQRRERIFLLTPKRVSQEPPVASITGANERAVPSPKPAPSLGVEPLLGDPLKSPVLPKISELAPAQILAQPPAKVNVYLRQWPTARGSR